MSKVQSPEPKVELNNSTGAKTDLGPSTLDFGLLPTPEELAVLSSFQRSVFRFIHHMNEGRWKRFWTWCQKIFGAGWIHFATYNLMQVYGLEHIEAASRDRPILIAANHRSFFDMYVVSTTLFRHTSWRRQLFFPVHVPASGKDLHRRFARSLRAMPRMAAVTTERKTDQPKPRLAAVMWVSSINSPTKVHWPKG